MSIPAGTKITMIPRLPLALRLLRRQGPTGYYYYVVPELVTASQRAADPTRSSGFYMSKGLVMDGEGSTFDLRVSMANDHIKGRTSDINGYYCDENGDGDTMQPIVARLPKQRGFLAGWTMGEGMASTLYRDVYDTIEEAAMGAHSVSEHAAEEEQRYQHKERQKEVREEKKQEVFDIVLRKLEKKFPGAVEEMGVYEGLRVRIEGGGDLDKTCYVNVNFTVE